MGYISGFAAMLSKSDARFSTISPVLFLTLSGEPMRFFLRPGPIKVELQPIIKAGGGLVCRAQEPEAILLADPDDIGSMVGSVAHEYVSTQYIRDCMEKNQQLEIEDYRFQPNNVKVNAQDRSGGKSRGSSGRMFYTEEEDEAIVKYVSTHPYGMRGNVYWQEMEKKGLTSHGWQGMKARYRKYLSHRIPNAAVGAGAKREGSSSEDNLASEACSPQRLPTPPQPDAAPQTSTQESDTPGSPSETEPPRAPSDIEGPQFLQASPHKNQAQCPEGSGTEEPPGEHRRPALPRSEMESSTLGEKARTSNTKDQKQGKTKAKRRKLGILEMAVREFESSDESGDDDDDVDDDDDDETPKLAAPLEQPVSRSIQDSPKSAVASLPESGLAQPQKRHQSPAQEKFLRTKPEGQPPEARRQATTGSASNIPKNLAVPSTSAAPHLFLFEHESQEVEEDHTPQAFTQLQIEQAKQVVLKLMRDSKLGLVEVTKALLKNSGDVSATLQCALMRSNPGVGAWQGPLWERRDDCLLLSGDTSELQKKFGERGVAKRMAFLDAE